MIVRVFKGVIIISPNAYAYTSPEGAHETPKQAY
jgi:hypothetical protein